MNEPVIVLGCGPAGLLAAHAVAQAGHEVRIYSRAKPSPIGGAQFLHRAIPELTSLRPDGTARFLHRGTPTGYARKVYGNPAAPTSWGRYEGEVDIWNMREAYRRLWEMYHKRITDVHLTTSEICHMSDRSPLVISTLPRKWLCWQPTRHTFEEQEVWIWYEEHAERRNYIMYNGQENVSWYRSSNLFGWQSIEWAQEPPKWSIGREKAKRVVKPLRTDCNCSSEIVKVGRYGMWQKEILIHDAYEMVLEMFEGEHALY